MNKRIIYAFFLFLLCFSTSFAQKKSKSYHEINFNIGTGMSSLIHSSDFGNTFFKWSNNLGINYTYFLSSKFGIGTGAEIALYASKFSGNNFENEQLIATPIGLINNFYLNAHFSTFEETQKITFINIPLLVTFQTPAIYENLFYVSAGVKAYIPITSSYKTVYGLVETSGYSDNTQQIYENMPEHGFDAYRNVKTDGKLDLSISFALTAETGMKWALSDKWDLYTGLWFDYGLNDIRNNSKKEKLIVYNEENQSNYSYNSFFSSQDNGEYLIEKATLTSFGFRIRLAFGK